MTDRQQNLLHVDSGIGMHDGNDGISGIGRH